MDKSPKTISRQAVQGPLIAHMDKRSKGTIGVIINYLHIKYFIKYSILFGLDIKAHIHYDNKGWTSLNYSHPHSNTSDY